MIGVQSRVNGDPKIDFLSRHTVEEQANKQAHLGLSSGSPVEDTGTLESRVYKDPKIRKTQAHKYNNCTTIKGKRRPKD